MQLYRLDVQTESAVEFREITARVEERVAASGIAAGLCYVFIPHTTAGVTINENADPAVRRDMIHALERAVPRHDPAIGAGSLEPNLWRQRYSSSRAVRAQTVEAAPRRVWWVRARHARPTRGALGQHRGAASAR